MEAGMHDRHDMDVDGGYEYEHAYAHERHDSNVRMMYAGQPRHVPYTSVQLSPTTGASTIGQVPTSTHGQERSVTLTPIANTPATQPAATTPTANVATLAAHTATQASPIPAALATLPTPTATHTPNTNTQIHVPATSPTPTATLATLDTRTVTTASSQLNTIMTMLQSMQYNINTVRTEQQRQQQQMHELTRATPTATIASSAQAAPTPFSGMRRATHSNTHTTPTNQTTLTFSQVVQRDAAAATTSTQTRVARQQQ